MHRRTLRNVLIASLVIALAACLGGAAARRHDPRGTIATAAPASVAARADMHPALQDTLRAILERGVTDSTFPGAIAVVGTHAGPLVTVAAGHLDWAPSPVPDENTIWDLASLTKVVGMTSAMMQLVERGVVSLDAPVQRYLPEWAGPNKDRVTVRHLLTHQSGLPAFKQHFKLNVSPDSTLRLFFLTPLDTLPGVRMVYSDIGAILLGKIVERASGEALDAYLERHVFTPLGMRDTRYRPLVELLARIAPTEKDPWRGRHLRGEVHDENAFALGGVSGHAGLFSTAHDLDHLARAYLNGGTLDGARLASAATIAQFTTVQDAAFSTRALGWDTPDARGSGGHYLERPAFGHTGYTGTSLWIAPQHDLYVMLLTNRVNPTRVRTGIAQVRVAVADAAMRALFPATVRAIDARTPAVSPLSTPRP
ncbi:MAG TPA: serine hydrolase domain-containing protein [Gemmatimonadaceae bacterium]|nr:serine hydrolase domain-containing protein [Gemmatimonadaceae bacterium]